jgi:hypothetical protein
VPLSDFPRYQLTFGPVHPLERLTAHLGGAEIWAKREDCNAGLASARGRLPIELVAVPRGEELAGLRLVGGTSAGTLDADNSKKSEARRARAKIVDVWAHPDVPKRPLS